MGTGEAISSSLGVCTYLISLNTQALTVPCMLAGLAGGGAYFGSLEIDATKPIMVCST